MHESCMSTGIRGLLSQISNTDCKGSVGLESVCGLPSNAKPSVSDDFP